MSPDFTLGEVERAIKELKMGKSADPFGLMHQSIPSANIPPGQPPEFCTYFQPGSREFVPSELPRGCPGVGLIIKVPSCQLMPHEGTFQLQTDLPSIAAL